MKILGFFGTLYRYPTFILFLVVILALWLAGNSIAPTNGVTYSLLAFIAYRFDREVNRQRAINGSFNADTNPEDYLKIVTDMVYKSAQQAKQAQNELKASETESRSFKNMYFRMLEEEKERKERMKQQADASEGEKSS